MTKKITGGLHILAPKGLPVRRPTAMSPLASYGTTFQAELNGEIVDPVLSVDEVQYVFDDGEWRTIKNGGDGEETGSSKSKELSARLKNLQEENNLLVIKKEALIDMLAEALCRQTDSVPEGRKKPNGRQESDDDDDSP